jgi:hypothetical protein
MRALCGAIITLGALIGLGLTALGIGQRYAGMTALPSEGSKTGFFRLHDLDTALLLVLITMMVMLVIGIGVAFLGLAYHHERRHHEMMSARRDPVTGPHV